MTTNLMIKCHSWMQWMQHTWTYQQKISRDGSGIARTFFPLWIALDDIRCDLDENLWPNAVHRVGYSFLSIAKMHCSILKPHFQNCSHIQRYRSLCGPNCESFCISFRQNACNDHIFQNPQTLLSFTLNNSQNTIHFEHIIQMLINCFQNW